MQRYGLRVLVVILLILVGASLIEFMRDTAIRPEAESTATPVESDLGVPLHKTNLLPDEVFNGDANGKVALEQYAGERLLRFGSREDLLAFVEKAREAGLDVAGILPALGTVRVRFNSEDELARLRALAENAEESENFTVSLPGGQPLLDPEVAGGTGIVGPDALAILGITEDNATWGLGVRIAILDTGLDAHTFLEGANAQSFSLLENSVANPHGTAVASLIAGTNPLVRGIAPGADILAIQVLDGQGNGDTFTLAEGIVQAVDQGARIINMSLGTSGNSPVLLAAVQYAVDRGVLLVASAGNEGVGALPYPAAYPGVVSVAAADSEGRAAVFSNFSTDLSLAAPGVGVFAAGPEDGLVAFSGTSASAPLVSGSVAALMSLNPGMGAEQALDLILAHANDSGPAGPDLQTGNGVIDVGRVLRRDESGIFDAAMADLYVDPARSDAVASTVVFTVQNRGTEVLRGVELAVRVDGEEVFYPLGEILPGASTSADLPIEAMRLLEDNGVVLQARVGGASFTDTFPENDFLGTSLQLVEPEQ